MTEPTLHDVTCPLDSLAQTEPDESNQFRKLAISHMVLGLMSITFGSVSIGISASSNFLSYGYTFCAPGTWCGFVFLITGIFLYKFISGRNATYVTASCWLSAFSTLFACALFSLELSIAATYSSENCCSSYQVALITFHSFNTAVACMEIATAVITCAVCFKVFCCFTSTYRAKINYISGSDAVPFLRDNGNSASKLDPTNNNASKCLPAVIDVTPNVEADNPCTITR